MGVCLRGKMACRVRAKRRFRWGPRRGSVLLTPACGGWGLGVGVQGLGFRVEDLGFRVLGFGFGVWGSGFGVQASGFRV